MNTLVRIVGNSAVVMCGQIISIGFSIVTSILLVRYLGTERFGEYSFVYSYLTLFQVFGMAAIDSIVLREISKDETKTEELVSNGVMVKFIFSVIGIILSNLIMWFMNVKLNTKILVTFASTCFLFSSGTLFETVFKSRLMMKYPVEILIVSKLLSASGMIVFILMKFPLITFIFLNLIVGIMIFPSMFNVLLSIIFIKKYIGVKFKFKPNFDVQKMLLKESSPLFISGLFGSIYSRIDQVLLHQMIGEKQLGYYAAAIKLLEPFNFVPTALLASMSPLFANFFVTSKEKFIKSYTYTFKYLLMFIFPVMCYITLYAQQIVKLLYGVEYLPTASLLRLVIWFLFFNYVGCVHTELMIVSGLQKFIVVFAFIQSIINLGLNLLLIPLYEGIGAGIAYIISSACGIPIGLLLTKEYVLTFLRKSIKPLFSSLIMCFILIIFGFNLIISILVGVIIYILCLILIKGIKFEDINYFKEIFRTT